MRLQIALTTGHKRICDWAADSHISGGDNELHANQHLRRVDATRIPLGFRVYKLCADIARTCKWCAYIYNTY